MSLIKTKVLSKAQLVGEDVGTEKLDSLYAVLLLIKELNPAPTNEQLTNLASVVNIDPSIVLQAFEDTENPHLEMLASVDPEDTIGQGEGIADSIGLDDDEVQDEGTNVLQATSLSDDENALIEFSGVDDLVNGPFGAPTNDPLNQALKVDAPIDTTELHTDQAEMLKEVTEQVEQEIGE